MNLIFFRHGEAIDNVKGLISDKEIYWSILTENGIKTIKESLKSLPNDIDRMYVSPFPRTIETAYYVYEKNPEIEVFVDNRIREIYYGSYSHKRNDQYLDDVRKKQIDGDYFIRFGKYGENRLEIEIRLCDFLSDIYNSNKETTNIIVVSHGTIISYMKRILNIRSSHIDKGQIEIFNNVDFDNLFNYMEKLKSLTD